MPPAPPNAYGPGTQLTVGSHSVSIIKYISSGGFAHVYTCNIDPPFKGLSVACLKRVQVPNKWQLNLLRQEVDSMKRLRGNPTIVSYIDSHASRLQAGQNDVQQYEVFLLMEYCLNNGLIDFMNTRLTNKLTEPEILVIMKDITLAVAMCHHLQPPLIHRDIKIENVLLDHNRNYKLCDFGSAVPYAPVPKNSQELQTLKDDIMQHTTPQYRSPEMIDLTRGFPIDDKLDIWALGCFLYKLCYYTTPFELQTHTSLQDLESLIVNCNHTLRIPHNRPGSMFSPRLKNIIKCCLREDPRRRPNGVQLLDEVCSMMHVKAPNVIPASVLERPHVKQVPHTQISPSNDVLVQVKSSPSLDIRKPSKPDPFASIDKSKLLQKPPPQPARPKSFIGNSRPNSIYGSRDALPIGSSQSTNHLKDYIKSQLSTSSESISKITSHDDDNNDDTLNFLRDMESISNQNTGGSIKASLKNGLRKISTGNSTTGLRSNNNTGSDYPISQKRSSISSIKQILTGGGSRKTSGTQDDTAPAPAPPKKLSIQRRMAQYLQSNDEQHIKKTAHGYGKYTTEDSDTDDLEAINDKTYKSRNSLMPPKVPASLSSQRARSLTPPKSASLPALTLPKANSKQSHALAAAAAKKKPVKKPPPKPTKPKFLRTPETNHADRRLSNSSEISIPDLDDMERQFAKRFPSYV